VHAHQADGGCHAIGVSNYLLERAIAFLAKVAPDAVDELFSIALGNLIVEPGIRPGDGNQVTTSWRRRQTASDTSAFSSERSTMSSLNLQ
jgi:hypothetical protein